MQNVHYLPARHVRPEPAQLECFECNKPLKDFGFWTNSGRVFQMRCVNRECAMCAVSRTPEKIPTFAELGWI